VAAAQKRGSLRGFDIVRDGGGLVVISSGGEIVAWATDQATAK
jgi:hypothetical protein